MAIPGGRLIRFRRGAGAGEAEAPSAADVIAALPAAVMMVDADGIVRNCNAAAETLLNVARSMVIGRDIEEVIGHPLTSRPHDQPFAAYDLDLILPVGRNHRADMTVAPLAEWPGWRAVAIHSRSSREIAARRGGRTVPAAAAASLLAHEVKNPLSGIRGAAQLLEAGLGAEQGELTKLIRDEVDRIARLIDRMESLSDTRPRRMEPINIHSALGHARDVAKRGFAEGRIIRELYDPSLPDVLGNRDSLVQILLNLIKNAAEATGSEGSITLTTAYRHGFSLAPVQGGERHGLPIELCVIDDGPGASEDIAANLFDPFVTTKTSGSGLGLALVDKLVSEMGGIVEYAREGSPERTVFRLLLPRAPRAGRTVTS